MRDRVIYKGKKMTAKEALDILTKDVPFSKTLDNETIQRVSKAYEIEYAALKAVIQVESAGSGFLKSGKPKILFEGHKFWQHLVMLGIDPEKNRLGNEDIIYPRWTKEHYKGGEGEYERLDRAMEINRVAAVYSASWGLFQIMGENINNGLIRRYGNIDSFLDAQYSSEKEHLLDFLDFIKNKKSKGKSLIDHLRAKNWADFARGYNGAGYAKNQYDIKLKSAYDKYK